MAKPIFLIGFPITAEQDAVSQSAFSIQAMLNDEYHVLVYRAQEIESVTFQVLNAINATDVEIEEVIQKANNYINLLTDEHNATS